MTKEEILRRQASLTSKMLAGTITKEERDELGRLTAAVTQATQPHVIKGRTKLTTMTVTMFKAYLGNLTGGTPTPDQIAIAKRNIASVKEQGVTDPNGVVAVEVLVEETPQEAMASLEDRIKQLEQKLAAKEAPASSGAPPEVPEKKQEEPAQATGGAPTATALAQEALAAVAAKLTALQQRIASGQASAEEVQEVWPGYDLKSLVESVVEIMGKAAAVKEKFDALLPELQKIAGENPEEGKEPAPSPGTTEKGDVDDWSTSRDLSPRSGGGAADHRRMRRSKGRFEHRKS